MRRNHFIDQFLGPRATILADMVTAWDFLIYGLGAWVLFACLVPRVAILAVPWVWGLCNGRWALRFLATEEWHHVRYTVLPVAMVLAAGVGYARPGALLKRAGRGFLLGLAGGGRALRPGIVEISARMSWIPRPISPEEVEAFWYWIGQVGPRMGFLRPTR